jgi:hypothetical protein
MLRRYSLGTGSATNKVQFAAVGHVAYAAGTLPNFSLLCSHAPPLHVSFNLDSHSTLWVRCMGRYRDNLAAAKEEISCTQGRQSRDQRRPHTTSKTRQHRGPSSSASYLGIHCSWFTTGGCPSGNAWAGSKCGLTLPSSGPPPAWPAPLLLSMFRCAGQADGGPLMSNVRRHRIHPLALGRSAVAPPSYGLLRRPVCPSRHCEADSQLTGNLDRKDRSRSGDGTMISRDGRLANRWYEKRSLSDLSPRYIAE